MSNQKAAERLILKRSTAFNCQRWDYRLQVYISQYLSGKISCILYPFVPARQTFLPFLCVLYRLYNISLIKVHGRRAAPPVRKYETARRSLQNIHLDVSAAECQRLAVRIERDIDMMAPDRSAGIFRHRFSIAGNIDARPGALTLSSSS